MKREREDPEDGNVSSKGGAAASEEGEEEEDEYVTKEHMLTLMMKMKEQEERLNKLAKQESSSSIASNKSKKAKLSEESGRRFEFEKNDKGEWFTNLSAKRRVTVSQWNNKPMISVREYYEKDGNMLPGKKGISLSKDQFMDILSMAPQIKEILEKM